MYVGEAHTAITSKLDFFIQSVEPRAVKASDDLVLNATAVSDKSYDVEFEFIIKELNKNIKATAKTNEVATVNFEKLPVGKYTAQIKGKNGDKEDTIEYKFEIINASQVAYEKTTISIDETANIKPSKNPIDLEIYNKKMGQYIDYISFIESTNSARLDTKIAAIKTMQYKNEYYETENYNMYIDINKYMGENNRLKNLESGTVDLLLTALVKRYAPDLYNDDIGLSLLKTDNLFEYYLYLAAKNEPILEDLKCLEEENNISNYNKLLIVLSYEYIGDYESARTMYNKITISKEERAENASLIALIDTFINKEQAIEEINEIIKNNPQDEYVRFAILSFFENNSNELENEETVTLKGNNLNETITLKGLQIKKYTIYSEDLSELKFETISKDINVTYSYQTSIEEINSDNIVKDVDISLDGNVQKGEVVTLKINFSDSDSGLVRIALPNSMRLALNYNKHSFYDREYFIQTNKIDYITIYKENGCSYIEIPLLVTLEGNYKFENIVYSNEVDEKYHVSNPLEI